MILGTGLWARSQFIVIPTNTTTAIVEIVQDHDTIAISGVYDYFAKSYDYGETLVDLPTPGITDAANTNFQIADGAYYISSGTGVPEWHFQILKSTTFGASWQTLYDTTGISFHTFIMADSTWGLMAGLFGQYAHCDGNDTMWTTELLFGTQALNALASASYGDSSMIVMTMDGAAIYTNDRAQSWNWGYCSNQITEDVQYITEDTIYSISHYNNGTIAEFTYSVDGGQHFMNIELGPNPGDSTYYGTYFDTRIYDMHFNTPEHGYIVGYNYDIDDGVIFETFDAGLNWIVYGTGYDEVLSALLYINDTLAFIGGTNGLLLKWNPSIPLSPVGIEEIDSNAQPFAIYPNPCNESTIVKFKTPNVGDHIEICNALGEVVFTEIARSGHLTISTSNLPDGIYYITVHNKNYSSSNKLIVQH